MNKQNNNNDWKIWETSECDWWLGRNEEEVRESVKSFYLGNTKYTDEQLENDGLLYKEIHPISDKLMDKLQYVDEDGTKRTFREELEFRLKYRVESKPDMFATTEI